MQFKWILYPAETFLITTVNASSCIFVMGDSGGRLGALRSPLCMEKVSCVKGLYEAALCRNCPWVLCEAPRGFGWLLHEARMQSKPHKTPRDIHKALT